MFGIPPIARPSCASRSTSCSSERPHRGDDRRLHGADDGGDRWRRRHRVRPRLGHRSRCRDEDRRVAAAVDDTAKPVQIVERRADGIVITGGKQHVLGAAGRARALVVPSGRSGRTCVACAVPVDAPGVRVIAHTPAPRAEDDRHFPVSRAAHDLRGDRRVRRRVRAGRARVPRRRGRAGGDVRRHAGASGSAPAPSPTRPTAPS